MQTGQAKYGMQTFNQSLATLYFKKAITLQTALARSSNPDELQEMISRGAGALAPQGPPAAAGQRPRPA
jgi:twitching motility protein PilT